MDDECMAAYLQQKDIFLDTDLNNVLVDKNRDDDETD